MHSNPARNAAALAVLTTFLAKCEAIAAAKIATKFEGPEFEAIEAEQADLAVLLFEGLSMEASEVFKAISFDVAEMHAEQDAEIQAEIDEACECGECKACWLKSGGIEGVN